jgi:hypothetical protein
VEDEHDLEAALHRVLDQPLKPRPLVREAPGLEVEVLLGQPHPVVGGVPGDRLALPVG